MSCLRGDVGKYDSRVLELYQDGYFTLDPKKGKAYGCRGKEIGAVKRANVGTTAYVKVSLPVRDGVGHERSHWCPLHRVIAVCCLGLPKGKKNVVNHKDGNGLNNRLSNLEWCTPKQNTQHAIHVTGTFSQNGESNKKALLTEKQARHILLSKKSEAELALKYKVGWKTIQTVRLGVRWRELFVEISKTRKYRNIVIKRKAKLPVTLTEPQRKRIRKSSSSIEELALDHNVSCSTISKILRSSK